MRFGISMTSWMSPKILRMRFLRVGVGAVVLTDAAWVAIKFCLLAIAGKPAENQYVEALQDNKSRMSPGEGDCSFLAS